VQNDEEPPIRVPRSSMADAGLFDPALRPHDGSVPKNSPRAKLPVHCSFLQRHALGTNCLCDPPQPAWRVLAGQETRPTVHGRGAARQSGHCGVFSLDDGTTANARDRST
jgi:hypothetical protein